MKINRQYFLDRINLDHDTGCWNWKMATEKRGYGRLTYKGKNYRSHRFSYDFFKGKIGEGLLVCHNCDKPSCINPEHLFLGTHKDNAIDCRNKGRSKHSGKFGKDHPSSKNVIQYSLHGKYIKKWDSTMCIQRKLGFHNTGISRCCLGKKNYYKGFIWSYI